MFVYEKSDDSSARTSTLNIQHTIFVEASATADYTVTRRLREMIKDGANEEDIAAYILDRNLPVDDVGAQGMTRDVLATPPEQGYLTISNALQWRLQYGHAIREAGGVPGVLKL